MSVVIKGPGENRPSDSKLERDARWQLVQRIITRKSFAKSPFLKHFLLYICDRELTGRSDEITEYQIGIHALGRPADYNPGMDNVVRNYARVLRRRLEEYFSTEGSQEPIHLRIPIGGYIPVFVAGAQPLSDEESSAVSPPVNEDMVQDHFAATSSHDSDPLPSTKVTPELLDDHTKATTWTQRNMLRGVAVIAGLVFLTIAVNHLRGTSWQLSSISLNHQFWIQVFAPDRDTIVVSADSGLGILENLSHKRVSLGDYVAGTYLTQPDKSENIDQRNWNDLRTQQYTSMADMNIAVSLSKQPEHISGRLAIRSARDIRMDEIKHANVILLGSVHTNPWVELFQQRMNFVLEYGPEVDDSVVTNRHPSAGEDAAYKNAWAENSHRTYAVLAFVPSMDNRGKSLLVEGLTMAGTQAAADFVFNESTMEPVLRKAKDASGTIAPFELLLETNSIGSSAPGSRIIAERYSSEAR